MFHIVIWLLRLQITICPYGQPICLIYTNTNTNSITVTKIIPVPKGSQKLQNVHGQRHEIKVADLYLYLKEFSNISSFLQNEIQITQSKPTMNDGIHPPFVHFDTHCNRTLLTWCNHHKLTQRNHKAIVSIEDDHELLLWESMRNKRIVFSGDSVIRFQYLDFVYVLTHNQWNGDNNNYQLVSPYMFQSNWTMFKYKVSQVLLNGYELCECYRPLTLDPQHFSLTENRKFYLPELNVTIWYLGWFGRSHVPHGRVSIDDDIQPLDCMPGSCSVSNQTDHLTLLNESSDIQLKAKQSSGWKVDTGAQLIDLFVRYHKPDLAYVTTGFHGWLNGKSDFAIRETKEFERRTPLWKERYGVQTKLIFRSTTLCATILIGN